MIHGYAFGPMPNFGLAQKFIDHGLKFIDSRDPRQILDSCQNFVEPHQIL